MAVVSSVLIVGGGMAGLCAGVALRQQGVNVDLVELQPSASVYGVGIIQPNNTLRALDRIGLAQACVDVGAAFPGWRIHDSSGNILMEAPATSAAAPAFPPINGITRPKLHEILVSAADGAGVNSRFGVTVDLLEQQEGAVDIQFTDGSSGRYDFVIGADGVNSDIRKRVFGNSFEPVFTGQGVWRYNLPRPIDMEWGGIYFGPNSKVGLVPLSSDLMYMFLVTAESDDFWPEEGSLAETMRTRLGAYSGFLRQLRDIVTESDQVVYRPMHNVMLPAPWMSGRVIVIGDAAHTTTPHLAQGAAMAIEDAILLGELLGGDGRLEDLLSQFMARRFSRAKFVVDSSTQIATWELEEWAGIHNPKADPGGLLHRATLELAKDY
jgi:2-polyprenyl-6-methoxyphenol hydroxylase-like FAD-dependent oxidoreductase